MDRYFLEQIEDLDTSSLRQLCGLLLEESRHPAVVCDVIDDGKDFIFSYVNQAMLDFEDVTVDKVLNKSVSEVFPGVKEFGLFDVMVKAWNTGSIQKMPLSFYRDSRNSGYRINTVYPLEKVGKVIVIYEQPDSLSKILNTIFGFIGIYDKSGVLIECNLAPLLAAGLEKKDVIGKPFWETPWWSHSKKEQEKIRSTLESAAQGKAVRDEFSVNVFKDEPIIIDASFEPLFDEHNDVDKLIGFGVDITERKRIEENLVTRDYMLNEAATVGMLDIWEFDIATRHTVNRSESSFLKPQGITTLDEFIAVIHEDDKDRVKKNLEDALSGRSSRYHHLFRMYFKDGSLHFITTRAKVINDDTGKPRKLIGVSIDISDETELGNRYRRMMEAIQDGLIMCLGDGTIQLANESICKLSGFSINDLIGRSVTELFPEMKDFNIYKNKQGQVGSVDNESWFNLLTRGEESVRVAVDFSFFQWNDKEYVTLAVRESGSFSGQYTRLLENQKEMLQISRQSHRIVEERRSELAREIHDEVGQNLTYIKLGLAKLLGNSKKIDSDSESFLEKALEDIDRTITNVRRITTDLRHPLLDDIGLEAAMRSQAREYKERLGLDFDLQFDLQNLEICEERKITFFRIYQEAMTNIARHSQASTVKVVLQQSNSNFELLITDNGKGFKLNKRSDMNMSGLSGMRQRARTLGGELNISSSPGQGTEIRAVIPIQ